MCRRDTFHLQGQRSNWGNTWNGTSHPDIVRAQQPCTGEDNAGTNQATPCSDAVDRFHLVNHSLASVHPTPAPPHRWPLTGACPRGVFAVPYSITPTACLHVKLQRADFAKPLQRGSEVKCPHNCGWVFTLKKCSEHKGNSSGPNFWELCGAAKTERKQR